MTAGRRHPIALVAVAVAAAAALLLLLQARDSAGAAGPVASNSKIATTIVKLDQLDQRTRLEVLCPKGKFPYGGGYTTSPPPMNGEGVYPNSFERLGVQHGYHVTANLVDLGTPGGSAEPRNVTLQVVCGPKPPKLTPPHETIQVEPGQQKEIIEKCPGNRHLIGGGYQRTTRVSNAGNFVTESRSTDTDTWRVAGTAVGGFGGQMTGLAYCVRSKKPLLSEVSASATIPPLQHGAATTPGCPAGRALVFGGFSTPPDGSILFLGGSIGTGWTANAFNEGLTPGQLTAYGYCLRFKALLKTKKKKKK